MISSHTAVHSSESTQGTLYKWTKISTQSHFAKFPHGGIHILFLAIREVGIDFRILELIMVLSSVYFLEIIHLYQDSMWTLP